MFDAVNALSHKGARLTNGNTVHAYTHAEHTADNKRRFGYQIVISSTAGEEIIIAEQWGYKDAEQAEQDASECLAELITLLNH